MDNLLLKILDTKHAICEKANFGTQTAKSVLMIENVWKRCVYLTLLGLGFFGSLKARGGGGGSDLLPPSKNGGNGWEVQKLSWNLISYQD